MTSLVKVMLLFDMVVDAVGARARRAEVQQHERSDRNGAVFQSTTPPNNKHEYRRGGGWTRCCLTTVLNIYMPRKQKLLRKKRRWLTGGLMAGAASVDSVVVAYRVRRQCPLIACGDVDRSRCRSVTHCVPRFLPVNDTPARKERKGGTTLSAPHARTHRAQKARTQSSKKHEAKELNSVRAI